MVHFFRQVSSQLSSVTQTLGNIALDNSRLSAHQKAANAELRSPEMERCDLEDFVRCAKYPHQWL